MGFESDPLYPGYYQSGPLEKASVGCHNLTLEGATVAQAAAFSRDQESQTQQMVDASILRNKVRNWYLEIETTLTLSKSTVRHQWCHESEAYQTFTLWSGGYSKSTFVQFRFSKKATQIWQNLPIWFEIYLVDLVQLGYFVKFLWPSYKTWCCHVNRRWNWGKMGWIGTINENFYILVKLRYYEKAKKIEINLHLIFDIYSVASDLRGRFFKLLWPSHIILTLPARDVFIFYQNHLVLDTVWFYFNILS